MTTSSTDIKTLLADYLEYLENHPITGPTEQLYEPANYIISLGGKRVRPLLCLLGYQLFSDETNDAFPLAHALEVFHNFTLIHDDIIDQAPIRRGKETAHIKWNVNQSILTGDMMLVKAYAYIAELNTSEEIKIKLIRGFNQMAEEVCQGQQLDFEFSLREDVKKEEYLEMIRLKTSVLLGYSLYAGSILGGANETQAQKLYDFGVMNGVAFQIIDDVLDAFGSGHQVGKQTGGDIIENKKTILYLELINRASIEDREEIQKLIQQKDQPEAKVQSMLALYRKYGIEEFAREKANEFRARGEASLDGIVATDTSDLRAFMKDLIDRMK